MFKSKVEGKVLKDAINAVAAIAEDAKLQLAATGWKVVAVDPANVAMVSLELAASAFESYELDGDTAVGIAFQRLHEILGSSQSGSISLNVDTQKLRMVLGGLEYSTTLLDVSALRKDPKLPSLEFTAKVTVETNELIRTIKAASKVGDFLRISADPEGFHIESEGSEDTLRLDLACEHLLAHEVVAGVQSLYSLDYVTSIMRGLMFVDAITLEFGNNYPLQLSATDVMKVSYLLAPRIDSD